MREGGIVERMQDRVDHQANGVEKTKIIKKREKE